MKAILRNAILLLGAGTLIWMALRAGAVHEKCRQCDKALENHVHTAMKSE